MAQAQNFLVRFGDYDISKHIASYRNSTPAYMNALQSIYGVDGGIEKFGTGANPKRPADLQAKYVFTGADSRDLQEQRDAFYEAHDGTMKRLYYAPNNTTVRELWRWTWAKPTDIDDSRTIEGGITQHIDVNYSLADPYWYAQRFTNQWYLDGGRTLDGNETFAFEDNFTLSVGSTHTIYNDGNAHALPVLVFDDNSGGATLGGFTFQRIVNTIAVESFTYAGTVQTGNAQLIVDCKSHSVTDYPNFTVASGQSGIMSLQPGINTLKLLSATTLTSTPQLYVSFDYTYHA